MSSYYTGAAEASNILGAHLQVGERVIGNSLPYAATRSEQLLLCLDGITQRYKDEQGLPARALFYSFERGQLLVLCFRSTRLLVLTGPDAPLAEIEIAGRKLVTTAHLQAPLAKDNLVVMALQRPAQVVIESPVVETRGSYVTRWTLAAALLATLGYVTYSAVPSVPAPIAVDPTVEKLLQEKKLMEVQLQQWKLQEAAKVEVEELKEKLAKSEAKALADRQSLLQQQQEMNALLQVQVASARAEIEKAKSLQAQLEQARVAEAAKTQPPPVAPALPVHVAAPIPTRVVEPVNPPPQRLPSRPAARMQRPTLKPSVVQPEPEPVAKKRTQAPRIFRPPL
jgi:hypothetical protein